MPSTVSQRLIAREAATSAAINMAISAAFYFALFGSSHVPVAGLGNFAFDFLPQAFMVTLMGSLVPALLASGRAGGGTKSRTDIVIRALAVAVLALLVAGGGAALLSLAMLGKTLPWASGLAIKLSFAVLLSVVVTPLAIRHAVSRATPDRI